MFFDQGYTAKQVGVHERVNTFDNRSKYRPYAGGVASRLATAIYVAMVTPILYDNFYSPNDSNLKYESYQPYG